MQLSEKLLRSFSDIIKSSAPKEKKQNPTVMGTVTDTEGGVLVQIDGSTIKTPAVTLVGVEVGDRVDVLIQNHRAVITGNRTAPAITRYGKTYTKLTDDGLIVGILDDNDQPTGLYLLVHPDDENPENVGFKVIDPVKKALNPNDPDAGVLASFGTVATIGEKGNNRVVIQDDGVHLWGENLNASMARFGTDMIDNTPTPIIRLGLMNGFRLKLTPTEIQFVDGSIGEILASFGGDSIVKRLETDAIGITTWQPDRNQARCLCRAHDAQDRMISDLWVVATADTGRGGLYDNIRGKWVINYESDGSVVSHTTPSQLNNTTYTATAISASAHTYVPIANLADWNMVIAYVRVGNEYTNITFIQGGPSYHRVNFYNNGRIITGEFAVEWANNRFSLCCSSGTNTDYTMVQMMQVYGILKKK